jgi:2'-5' RNA ligase
VSDDAAPIIVTVQLDAVTADRFEAERRRYFPPALNRVPAHLTLFHALPGEAEREVVVAVAAAVRRPPFAVAVDGLRPLGRGVAYTLAASELGAVREAVSRRFAGRLTAQDREKFRPHVTVQNKVSPGEARATLELLARNFVPFEARAEGLQLWRYRGGPWQPLGAMAFGG